MVRFGVEGTVDVFEEVPSILVVIVATFLFLMVMAESVVSYSRFQEERFLEDELVSFCDSVLSFEHLLFDSAYGQLDSTRLDSNTREGFHEHFDPRILGFHYNITLLDVSSYRKTYTWFAGEIMEGSDTVRMTSVPTIIRSETGQHHPAILRICIWR